MGGGATQKCNACLLTAASFFFLLVRPWRCRSLRLLRFHARLGLARVCGNCRRFVVEGVCVPVGMSRVIFVCCFQPLNCLMLEVEYVRLRRFCLTNACVIHIPWGKVDCRCYRTYKFFVLLFPLREINTLPPESSNSGRRISRISGCPRTVSSPCCAYNSPPLRPSSQRQPFSV